MVVAIIPFTAAQHALLTDAVLAGLTFDLQETPARWQNAPMVAENPKPAHNFTSADAPTVVKPLVLPAATPLAVAAAPDLSENTTTAPQALPKIWQAGEAGGVVVLVAAEGPLAPAAAALLGNMLKAIGLQTAPLAFVGMDGLPSKAQQPTTKAELVAKVAALQPTHTLVLGQGLLGVCLGKLQGVEGWQAAPISLGLAGQVGVTFPLDLLLNKPLFKGLAWQHLQAWQRGWQEKVKI